MGILFTRGAGPARGGRRAALPAVSSEGHGLIGPSAFLSPNTALVLGQGDTLDRLERADGASSCPAKVDAPAQPEPLAAAALRRWSGSRNIPNRTAMALYQIGGGPPKPTPDGPLVRHRRGELRRA